MRYQGCDGRSVPLLIFTLSKFRNRDGTFTFGEPCAEKTTSALLSLLFSFDVQVFSCLNLNVLLSRNWCSEPKSEGSGESGT